MTFAARVPAPVSSRSTRSTSGPRSHLRFPDWSSARRSAERSRTRGETLPRAVYISTPLIAGLYILGTAAVLWIVPTGSVNVVTGFLQGIDVGAARFGHWLWWLAPLAAASYTLGNIGGTGAWLTRPGTHCVRDRTRSLFPARVRPGAPALGNALCRHSRAGSRRVDPDAGVPAWQRHDGRAILSRAALRPGSDLLHPVHLPVPLPAGRAHEGARRADRGPGRCRGQDHLRARGVVRHRRRDGAGGETVRRFRARHDLRDQGRGRRRRLHTIWWPALPLGEPSWRDLSSGSPSRRSCRRRVDSCHGRPAGFAISASPDAGGHARWHIRIRPPDRPWRNDGQCSTRSTSRTITTTARCICRRRRAGPVP